LETRCGRTGRGWYRGRREAVGAIAGYVEGRARGRDGGEENHAFDSFSFLISFLLSNSRAARSAPPALFSFIALCAGRMSKVSDTRLTADRDSEGMEPLRDFSYSSTIQPLQRSGPKLGGTNVPNIQSDLRLYSSTERLTAKPGLLSIGGPWYS
jgi:hypothetical protein